MSRKPLSEKLHISNAKLSAKIAKVKDEDPGLSNRAAVGKAVGILAGRKGMNSRKILSGK